MDVGSAVSQLVKPSMALRIAVAGNRDLSDGARLSELADEILAAIEDALVSLASDSSRGRSGGDMAGAYSTETPHLHLVSGLADGIDQVFAEAFLARQSTQSPALNRSIAAVVPFDVDTYRDKSPIADVERFTRLLGKCRYVMELDGRYEDGDGIAARRARNAAYRAQAAILLRRGDILIAVEDPSAAASPGGTRETVSRALSLGVPVLHVKVTRPENGSKAEIQCAVLLSIEDLSSEYDADDWQARLPIILRTILATPRLPDRIPEKPADSHSARDRALFRERREYESQLLEEFYGTRPLRRSLRERLWRWFESRFGSRVELSPDEIPSRFADWRKRARGLSAQYAGLYRGTFLLNFALAVLAVCLAVGSLIVLIHAPEDAHGHLDPSATQWLILLVFGIGKLAVLVGIALLTRQAIRANWNEKAIDFRYLAERLRSMAYLPTVGSMRTSAPRSAGYATRTSTQRMVDWLFAARVREVTAEAGGRADSEPERIRLNPLSAATAIREGWIANQALYHGRNEQVMARINHWLEKAGTLLNITVVGVVILDLIGLLFSGPVGDVLHNLSPWLLLMAAVLPAAVASLNGIRFQSECARLADRSTQMRWLLRDLETRANDLIRAIEKPDNPATGALGHTAAVLDLAEDCAQVMLDEVSEWTFVYAKELVEP